MKNNKPSLRQILCTEIMKRGFMRLDEVHALANQYGSKESTAERRLRESESPSIEAVRNKRGFVTGYRYKLFNAEQQIKKSEEVMPRMQPLF